MYVTNLKIGLGPNLVEVLITRPRGFWLWPSEAGMVKAYSP